jgi:3-oxoacyl-[acyl-carrier protein] reductase
MLLKNKNAIIYGAGGAVGGAVARAFAREGAKVFCTGRTLSKLQAVAADIRKEGGWAESVKLDALDKNSIETYLECIEKKDGGIDISFNAIGLEDIQGQPLTQMTHAQFALPIVNAIPSHFYTATAAARHMARKGGGVILAITANVAVKPFPNVGGFGVACAAIESFCRQLAAEVGKQGVRVICLRSAGSPDAPGVDEVFNQHAERAGVSREEFEKIMAEDTMLKRLPKLDEVANVAVLMASDRANIITGAIANVTCGEIAD